MAVRPLQTPAPAVTRLAALPRGPVLDWQSLTGHRSAEFPAIDLAPARLLVTSGRAALALALQSLQLPPGTRVLVPTYHCPTMIAPVLHTGLVPVFYALGEDALPRLDLLEPALAQGARAIIVAHLFGLPRSLAAVREWCDAHGVTLIEDCAHSFFGQAGERPVGAWGDYATASLTKFFPVPEAGLLVSARHGLPALALQRPSLKSEVKGAVDVLEAAANAGRLHGLRPVLQGLFSAKNHVGASLSRRAGRSEPKAPAPVAVPALHGTDMSRSGHAPLAVARWAYTHLPRARIALRRQANFQQLKLALAGVQGARLLFDATAHDVPYALPLWVDDAERVYQGLRAAGMPVFRWDQRWPGTPVLEQDAGATWCQHVLQLLCHQDLGESEIALMASTTRQLL